MLKFQKKSQEVNFFQKKTQNEILVCHRFVFGRRLGIGLIPGGTACCGRHREAANLRHLVHSAHSENRRITPQLPGYRAPFHQNVSREILNLNSSTVWLANERQQWSNGFFSAFAFDDAYQSISFHRPIGLHFFWTTQWLRNSVCILGNLLQMMAQMTPVFKFLWKKHRICCFLIKSPINSILFPPRLWITNGSFLSTNNLITTPWWINWFSIQCTYLLVFFKLKLRKVKKKTFCRSAILWSRLESCARRAFSTSSGAVVAQVPVV